MTTLFISDLHLNDMEPHLVDQFEHFIETDAVKADALYILGDLFNTWIGDDTQSQTAKRVCQALKSLSSQGVNVYYMHGNRDFLVGERYAKQCGMTLLPDPTVIDCEGTQVLLTHGDLLCTNDKSYQRFREFVHRPFVQKLFLSLPLSFRETIAGFLRKQSSISGQNKMAEVMDVTPETVVHWFNHYGIKYMIHGHTHKPSHHELNDTHRYVLGAWDLKRQILRIDGDKWSLEN